MTVSLSCTIFAVHGLQAAQAAIVKLAIINKINKSTARWLCAGVCRCVNGKHVLSADATSVTSAIEALPVPPDISSETVRVLQKINRRNRQTVARSEFTTSDDLSM